MTTSSPVISLSVAIPTYQRGDVLLETIDLLKDLEPAPLEILIIDQTQGHEPDIAELLQALEQAKVIRWIRLPRPSIPKAMNTGLQLAKGDIVLFLDDDIIPDSNLLRGHLKAHQHANLVVGQVIQPKEKPLPLQPGEPFRFNSTEPCYIQGCMAGNLSIKTAIALGLGGFDENFQGAAFNFELEFAHRYCKQHGAIFFEPSASIHHLMAQRGGTRAHGHHLRTAKPNHTLGAYYYLMKSRPSGWILQLLNRPIKAIHTKHHLRHPWWIPLSLWAEFLGFIWALKCLFQGSRYIKPSSATLPAQSTSSSVS